MILRVSVACVRNWLIDGFALHNWYLRVLLLKTRRFALRTPLSWWPWWNPRDCWNAAAPVMPRHALRRSKTHRGLPPMISIGGRAAPSARLVVLPPRMGALMQNCAPATQMTTNWPCCAPFEPAPLVTSVPSMPQRSHARHSLPRHHNYALFRRA